MKKNLSIVCLAVLAAVLLGIGPIATAQDQPGDVFKTPEEAIKHYLQGVAQGDVSQIMQACAINEMSENFRFDLYTNRLRVLTHTSPAPSDYPFYAEVNEVQFTWQILNQVKYLAYGLLSTEQDLLEGRLVHIDPAGTTRFMEEVNPARLAQLQVTQIGVPRPDMVNSERLQENWNTLAQGYGADEFTERVALFLFEGNTYYVGFGLLRYGESWKISNASSVLGNTNPLGGPQQTTEAEFQELIGGN